VLHELDHLPRGLLDAGPTELGRLLPGPSLLHLEGRRKEPLFIAVLLHGDEETGWLAARELLRRYRERTLPRSLSLFVGNVSAAREGKRSLPGQCDYNRIWSGNGGHLSPEESMAAAVVDAMRKQNVFVTVDVHNNTGLNPHYAYVQRLGNRFLQLAAVFGRLVVFSRKPEGTLCGAFSALCPSVAVECGRAEDSGGVPHTLDFLDACLHLAGVPDHPPAARDVELYHSLAVVSVPDTASISFDGSEADFAFRRDLDRLNFQELATGTRLAVLPRGRPASLEVRDEDDLDVAERYFSQQGGELRSATPFIPAMFTVSEEAVRQDCLGYLMERMGQARKGAGAGD
jgi:hypothetical protein